MGVGLDRPVARHRDRRPFALAGATAAVSLLLTYLALRQGWLGADVGRGDSFCESARPGWLKQPANSLSNLGFVAAGLAVGWYAGRPDGRLARPALAPAYAAVVVLLGPGSMAMHATQAELGGRLDQLSMYLVAGFAAAYALMRRLGRGTGFFLAAYAGLVLASEAVEQAGSGVPVVNNAGNAVFGLVLLVAIALEVTMPPSTRSLALAAQDPRAGDTRWVWASVGAMAVAFTIWNVTKTGPLCHPQSLLQGHAVWHLLCALAAYCLYRYWASAAATG